MRIVGVFVGLLLVVTSSLLGVPASALATANTFSADALPTWQTNGTVWAMAGAGGKVFAGGSFTAVRAPGTAEGDPSSLTRTNLVVLDAATGVPSTTCVLNATRGTSTAIVRAITASPDGKTVYIGGLFSQITTASPTTTYNRQNIVAVDVDTCSVKPFNPLPSSYVYAIAVTSDTVYLGGTFGTLGSASRSRLGAVSTAGAVLAWAPVADDEILALATDPNNGNVIIGGRMNTINSQDSHALAVVDGVAGTTNIHNYPQPFIPWTPGTGQRAGTSAIKAITADAGGFYIGAEGTGGGLFDGRAAFDWGTYNQRWRDTCLGATQALVTYNGVLYNSNHAHDCSTEGMFEDGVRHYLNAETTADKKYLPWWPNTNAGIGEGIGPRAMTIATTGSGPFLWYGGEFTTVNGADQRGLTRFGTTDSGAPDVPQTPNAASLAPGQVQVTWRASQDNDDKDLTYTLYRDSSTTPIATLQAPSVFWSRPQLSFTDTGLTPGKAYSYRVKASDGTGMTANTSAYSLSRNVTVATVENTYAKQVRSDGASVYFRMEETSGTAASDLGSNSSLGASYVNAFTRNTAGALIGSSDTSATFDGATSSAFLRTDEKISAPATYSEELWFKTSTTTGGKLIGFGNKGAVNGVGTTKPLSPLSDRHVYMRNDGKLTFGTTKTGVFNTITSGSAYNDNQWHHLVASQNGSGMSLYVDTVRVAQNSVASNQDNVGYWRVGGDAVGASWPSAPTSPYFAGSIDEAVIYPNALSTAQIRSHYELSGRTAGGTAAPTDNYGAAVYADGPELYWRLGEATGTTADDSAGNSHTGTYSSTGITRGVTAAVSGTSNAAIKTNGSTGLISGTKSASAPSTFSEELWFNTTTTTGGKLIGWGNVATGNSTSYDKHIYLGNDGKLRFGVWFGGVSTTLVSPTALNNGAWHHIVGTQDSSGQKLYVDGALVASNAVTTNQAVTGYWRVGGDTISTSWPDSPTSKYINASIDEVAVYLSALSPSQIAAHRALGVGQVAPDTQAPTVPTGLTAAMSGANAGLSWTAASDNVAVTKYAVYRSAVAGFTASAATKIGEANGSTSYTDTAPPAGTWYYVVTALDAVGNTSPQSSPASVTVTDTTPPSNPSALTATVNGASASLSWTAATDNVAVTRYELHRSVTSGFTPSAQTKVSVAVSTSATDAPATDGTYCYKVVAYDAAGNASAPSNEVTAVIASPDTAPPSAPTGLAASRNGADVTLTWTASTDNRGVVRYDVHRSTAAGFTPVPGTKVAEANSPTYVDAGLTSGTYYFRVVAVDAAGNVSALSNQAVSVVDLANPTAPSSLAATVDGSTVNLTWTEATDDIGVDSYAVYRSATAGFTPAPADLVGTSTTTAYGDNNVSRGTYYYRVVARDAGNNSGPPSNQAQVVVADSTGPSTPGQLTTTVSNADVALSWSDSTDDVGVTGYRVHRSTTSGFTPDSGNLLTTVTDHTYTDAGRPLGTYYYKVVAEDAAGNRSSASAQAKSVVVDYTAPSKPGSLQATVNGGTVNLTWAASTDDTGVTGYQVHRSTTSGFTPTSSTKIADVTGITYADTGRSENTYYYKVIAVDAAGNNSSPSDQASATVTAAPVTQTVSLVPVEDSYGNKGAPNTTYGTQATMASRGGASPYIGYLKFDVPTPPAGGTLVGATLKVRTTTDTFAGSLDRHQVTTSPSSWTEAGLTWNNEPALGSTIGEFAANTEPNTDIQATINPAGLTGSSGSTISLGVTSTSSDNLWFWTRSHANTKYRPTLVLTYQIG